jgi:hypothetical protein
MARSRIWLMVGKSLIRHMPVIALPPHWGRQPVGPVEPTTGAGGGAARARTFGPMAVSCRGAGSAGEWASNDMDWRKRKISLRSWCRLSRRRALAFPFSLGRVLGQNLCVRCSAGDWTWCESRSGSWSESRLGIQFAAEVESCPDHLRYFALILRCRFHYRLIRDLIIPFYIFSLVAASPWWS